MCGKVVIASKGSDMSKEKFCEIVVPRKVVRCGYPMSFDDALAYVDKNANIMREVHNLLQAVVGHSNARDAIRIRRECAYLYLKGSGFGGNVRSIYYTPLPDEVVQGTYVIRGSRRVVTGTYVQGTSFEDSDPEPPHLENQKHHVIFTLDRFCRSMGGFVMYEHNPFEVCASDVRVVPEKDSYVDDVSLLWWPFYAPSTNS